MQQYEHKNVEYQSTEMPNINQASMANIDKNSRTRKITKLNHIYATSQQRNGAM